MRAYVAEKLVEAVDVLVAGALRERLFEASTYVLRIGAEQIADEELRRDLEWIKASLTSARPAGSGGSVTATLRIMGDDDASAIARRILDLVRKLFWRRSISSSGSAETSGRQ